MKRGHHPRAKSRLRELRDHFRDVNAVAFGRKPFAQFQAATEHLPAYPELFPVFYDRALPLPPRLFRRAIISDYAIVYVLVPERDAVLIVDYWHTARDPDALRESLD